MIYPIVGSKDMIPEQTSTELPDRSEEKIRHGSESVVADEDVAVAENFHMAQLEELDSILLTQLARQLEYYFSRQNLSKDTYLQTLRDLNDGCVSLLILANFAKVKQILPYPDEETRVQKIVEAASAYTSLLEVVSVDRETSKVVEREEGADEAKLFLGIRPVNNEPLVLVVEPALDHRSVSNTVILRDVVDSVTFEEVVEVFSFEECPPVLELHRDVANCWFVTLGTDSREAMVRVMMQLQSRQLGGCHIHARLKSVAHVSVDTAPVTPLWAPQPPVPSRKKKKRSKKKARRARVKASRPKENPESPPPSMGEDNFPDLQDKKVEWESIPEEYTKAGNEDSKHDDDEGPKSLRSDAASTATTTSSSTESNNTGKKTLPSFGYAAALMKAPSPSTLSTAQVATTAKRMTPNTLAITESEVSARVVVQPPTWGHGRSFADVLKTEDSQ